MMDDHSRAPLGACSTKAFALALFTSFALSAVTGQALAVVPEGMVDVTATQYGATPRLEGAPITNDDSGPIRAAILDVTNPGSTNYSKTVYFPSGIYDLGSKIDAVERREDPDDDCGSHRGRGTVVLVGATNGPRPELRLANGKYKSGTHYVLEIRNQSRPACGFRDGLRGININLGSNNAGAVGLRFDVAQDSFLEDVKVIAGTGNTLSNHGRAGIVAVPGRSMATANIEVVGGKIGMDLQSSSLGATLVGVKLREQREIALTWNAFRGLTIVGLEIEMPNNVSGATQAIRLSGSDAYAGHLALYDASIKFLGSTSTRTAIANTTNRAVSLTNVFVTNAKKIVDHNEGTDIEMTGSGTKHILSYIRAPRGISGVAGVYRIDGVTKTPSTTANDPPIRYGTASTPANLFTRHTWTSTRSFTDSDVIQPTFPPETEFNPDTDDARFYIQKAIDDAAAAIPSQTVFIPGRTYLISDTINLYPNSRLIGVPGFRSVLKPQNWIPTGPSWVVAAANNKDATTLIQDMAFDTPDGPTDQIGGLHWQAGRYSMVRRVRSMLAANHNETDKVDYLIDGWGGGRWYGIADHPNLENGGVTNAAYRKVLVSGTEEPLTFYGLNLERGGTDKRAVTQYPFGELRDAKNARVFGQKMEIDGANNSSQPLDKGIAWDINGDTENVFFTMVYINELTTPAPLVRVASTVERIALVGLYALPKTTATKTNPLLVDANGSVTFDRTKWIGMFSRDEDEIDHNIFIVTP